MRGWALAERLGKESEALLVEHYDELRRIARRVLAGDAPKLGIQPTELAHEAAIRVLKLDRMDFAGRTHFLATSARMARQILLNEVRRAKAGKRQARYETFWPKDDDGGTGTGFDLELFDDALTRLAAIDAERAAVVEQRFFAGLTLEEIAEASGQSLSTVKRRWRGARAWLAEQMAAE